MEKRSSRNNVCHKSNGGFASTFFQYCLILSFLPSILSNHNIRAYKDGDVILGGLFDIHFASDAKHCGELFTMGLGHAEALIFAVESVNQDSTILPNVTLGYDIRDYCESSAFAMQTTYDFVRSSDPVCKPQLEVNSTACARHVMWTKPKPISALIGPYNSGSAVLVGSLLPVATIPAISPTATSVELSSLLYKDFFRTVPPDNWQAKVMADIIERFNWTYVAAVGIDDSYGRNGIWALEKESYERKSYCVAFSEFIPRLSFMSKIRQTVLMIKEQANIGVIILWLSGGYGRAFLKQATLENLEGKTLILSDALTAEEAVFLDPQFTVLDGSLGIQPRDYPDKKFEEHLKEITPKKSVGRGVVWWEELWRSQFNCSTKTNDSKLATCAANLTSFQAIKKIRSSFVSYLIDAVYSVAHALNGIYNCGAQGLPHSQDHCPQIHPTIKGSDVVKYLKNVSFDGLTGKIRFDNFGDPLAASYDIVNFQRGLRREEAHKKVLVGFWDRETTPRLHLEEANLKWGSLYGNISIPVSFCAVECLPGTMKSPTTPCCWECIKCPQGTTNSEAGAGSCKECGKESRANKGGTKCEKLPLININMTSTTGICLITVTLVGLVFTVLAFAVFVKFFETPIVKASSGELCFLLLFGITCLFGVAILELGEPSNLLCCVGYSLRYAALNSCITVLFLKTMRITSVFKVDKIAELFTPCFRNMIRQAIMIFAMNLTAICLITTWLILDPPGRETLIRADDYIFLVCKPFRTSIGYILFLAVCSYTLTIALLCTFYAFKARSIPENFNEAKYIGFSMYILLLSSLAYYPVVFSFESWYVTLVACSTTLVSSFGLLSCIFGPKVYVMLFQPQQNTVLFVRSQVSHYSFHRSKTKIWAAPTMSLSSPVYR